MLNKIFGTTAAKLDKAGLSGCTFSESVTWGKYREANDDKLVQIWGEYSVIFPLLAVYTLDNCTMRLPKNIISQMPAFIKKLENAQ